MTEKRGGFKFTRKKDRVKEYAVPHMTKESQKSISSNSTKVLGSSSNYNVQQQDAAGEEQQLIANTNMADKKKRRRSSFMPGRVRKSLSGPNFTEFHTIIPDLEGDNNARLKLLLERCLAHGRNVKLNKWEAGDDLIDDIQDVAAQFCASYCQNDAVFKQIPAKRSKLKPNPKNIENERLLNQNMKIKERLVNEKKQWQQLLRTKDAAISVDQQVDNTTTTATDENNELDKMDVDVDIDGGDKSNLAKDIVVEAELNPKSVKEDNNNNNNNNHLIVKNSKGLSEIEKRFLENVDTNIHQRTTEHMDMLKLKMDGIKETILQINHLTRVSQLYCDVYQNNNISSSSDGDVDSKQNGGNLLGNFMHNSSANSGNGGSDREGTGKAINGKIPAQTPRKIIRGLLSM